MTIGPTQGRYTCVRLKTPKRNPATVLLRNLFFFQQWASRDGAPPPDARLWPLRPGAVINIRPRSKPGVITLAGSATIRVATRWREVRAAGRTFRTLDVTVRTEARLPAGQKLVKIQRYAYAPALGFYVQMDFQLGARRQVRRLLRIGKTTAKLKNCPGGRV